MINKYKQRGAEAVEFAMIALLFFALLFAIVEFSRALFTWNALTEATRRGARIAVVCPFRDPIPAQVAIFDVIDGKLGSSPIISGLTPEMVKIRYFQDDNAHTEVKIVDDLSLIKFVEVSIEGYTHTLFIPLWGDTINSPTFKTILASESLGAVPTYPGENTKAPECINNL